MFTEVARLVPPRRETGRADARSPPQDKDFPSWAPHAPEDSGRLGRRGARALWGAGGTPASDRKLPDHNLLSGAVWLFSPLFTSSDNVPSPDF